MQQLVTSLQIKSLIFASSCSHLYLLIKDARSFEHKPHIKLSYTAKRRLTTWIRSEKRVVRRFGRCANVIECTYTNLDSTV